MSEQQTPVCGLPLVQPAQAQKHVTVNEGLMRLDGLVNLVLQGIGRTEPPAAVIDGQCWGVPEGAVNAWEGQAGRVAIAVNGGWVFADPVQGQRAFLAGTGVPAIHDGTRWRSGALTMGGFGGGLCAGITEAEVELSGGESIVTTAEIPAGVMVVGVSARVSAAMTGTAQSWSLGTDGALDRFGNGLGVAQGSWVRGLLGQPMTYWQAAPLIVTAQGGQISGGRLRLAIHWLDLALPD